MSLLDKINIISFYFLMYRSANLSHQFYALSAYEYLLHQQLLEQWEKVLQLPDQDQLLEKGNTMIQGLFKPLTFLCCRFCPVGVMASTI